MKGWEMQVLESMIGGETWASSQFPNQGACRALHGAHDGSVLQIP